jgi:type II secretion system protein H
VKTTCARSKYQGAFTLIELLAVVFVVGLIASLVVVNIERDDDQFASKEARRFAALLRHLQDESILQGFVMGIVVDPVERTYHFMVQKAKWQVITDDDILRERKLPGNVKLGLLVQEITTPEEEAIQFVNTGNEPDIAGDQDEPGVIPQIIVEPNGLTSSFTLIFTGSSRGYEVKPDQDQGQAIVVDES